MLLDIVIITSCFVTTWRIKLLKIDGLYVVCFLEK